MRVGEQRAQVWKQLYFKPFLANFSAVGVSVGPPNALVCPNPTSSSKTMTTFGALAGAFTSKRGGALALRTSRTVTGVIFGSGIGRTVRSSLSGAGLSAASSFAGACAQDVVGQCSCPEAAT